MKAKFTLQLFLFCTSSLSIFGQIYVTKSDVLNVNQRYSETSIYYSHPSAGSRDANTKTYSYSLTGYGPVISIYFLVRKQNYWQIEYYSNSPSPSTKVLFKQSTLSYSDIPACSNSNPWQKWNGGYGSDYSGNLPAPQFTGVLDEEMNLKGACMIESSKSQTILPSVFELPSLSNLEISQIQNPGNGSLVFDKDALKIKNFRNGSWINVSDQQTNNFNPCTNSKTVATTSGGNTGPSINLIETLKDEESVYLVGSASHSSASINLNNFLIGLWTNTLQHFIIKFSLDKQVQNVIYLGQLNVKRVKESGEYLYVTGDFSTSISFNNISYFPSGGKDAILLKIRKSDGTVVWVKTFSESFNEMGVDLSVSQGYVYWIGTFENASKSNTFIKKINDSDGSEITSATINSSSNLWPKSIYAESNKIHILGTNESSFNVTSQSVNQTFNSGQGTSVFLINLETSLNPNTGNNLFLNDVTSVNQLSVTNLEVVNVNEHGNYIKSFRFGVNALNLKSNILGEKVYGGGYILTTPISSVNNFTSIEKFNYLKLINVSKGFVIGLTSTSASNHEESFFIGDKGSQTVICQLDNQGRFTGVVNFTLVDDWASIKLPNLLFNDGRIEMPIVMSGLVHFCGYEYNSLIRNTIRWVTLYNCFGNY